MIALKTSIDFDFFLLEHREKDKKPFFRCSVSYRQLQRCLHCVSDDASKKFGDSWAPLFSLDCALTSLGDLKLLTQRSVDSVKPWKWPSTCGQRKKCNFGLFSSLLTLDFSVCQTFFQKFHRPDRAYFIGFHRLPLLQNEACRGSYRRKGLSSSSYLLGKWR